MARKKVNELPDFFTKVSRKDEEVLWSHEAKEYPNDVIHEFMSRFVLVLAALYVFIGIPALHLPLVVDIFLYALGAFLVIYYFAAPKDLEVMYLLTNERAIRHTKGRTYPLMKKNKDHLRFLNYEKIEKCKARDSDNTSDLHFIVKGDELVFRGVGQNSDRTVYNIAVENIRKTGQFKPIDLKLINYGEQLNLRLEKINKNTVLKGNVDTFPFFLKLEGVAPIEKLYMEFLIPNPENNAFQIRSKNTVNIIQKKRVKEIEIGNEKIDEEYVIEGDNPFFMNTVFSAEILELLNGKLKPQSISFGDYKKSTKKIKFKAKRNAKASDTILDAHLLEDLGRNKFTETLIDLDATRTSKLVFELTVSEEKDVYKTFSNELDTFVDLFRKLAKEVKKYNKEI